MTEWKTIDSAPEDGRFLVCTCAKIQYVGCRQFYGDGFSIAGLAFEKLEGHFEPTHWMPLPPPPAAGSQP